MWPALNVYQLDETTPVVVEPLTVDFEEYEDLVGDKETNNGQKLFIAYRHLVGESREFGHRRAREPHWVRTRGDPLTHRGASGDPLTQRSPANAPLGQRGLGGIA